MGVLEQVIQMKNLGASEEEITAVLQEKRFSPREIKDALDQYTIKKAVSKNPEDISPPAPTETYSPPEEAYNPPPAPQGQPATELYSSPPEYYYPQQPQGEPYAPPTETSYPAEGGYTTDTIIDVAEQVISDKISKINRKFEELNEFKSLYQAKIDMALERIKRMESIIDQLQISILERIGSYGQNLESIKKEMTMMQDSFGKALNPILDHSPYPAKSKNTTKIRKSKK
jgi:hypothetical protein